MLKLSKYKVEYKLKDNCYKYATFLFDDCPLLQSNEITGAYYCDYLIDDTEEIRKYIKYFGNRFSNKIVMTKKSYTDLPIKPQE